MMNKTPLEVEEKPDNHCCDTRNIVAYALMGAPLVPCSPLYSLSRLKYLC